ncbi:MAG: monomeric [FeFe] hydrogenase [Promethearchaeota archaeon]
MVKGLPRLNIFEKMRGIFTPVTDLRRQVLSAVSKMIVDQKPPEFIEQIPYQIIKKDTPTYRSSVFHERAIVRERTRLAFGMDLKEFGAHSPVNDEDVINSMSDHKILQKPIVNVIKIGCERCPEISYLVTDLCRGCIAHPCISVCPTKAISILSTPVGKRSFIDQEKCIKCGKCAQVCPYNAIAFRERPCSAACGVNAISSDDEGYASINYDKCVSCGMCIISCPFGAIAEKSEIVQIQYALKSTEKKVYAEIAPSFIGQFGPIVSPEQIIAGIKQIGFHDVVEVAYGADIVVLNETKELIELINRKDNCKEEKASPEKCKTFVGTSCCTAWNNAAHKNFPEIAEHNISESFAPMVETAKKIHEKDPNATVVFIGPCIAKKEECFIPEVAKYIEFVMTFEELAALFQAFGIDPSKIKTELSINDASTLGRGFPVAGGVAQAVITQTKAQLEEKIEIPTISADTLKNCMDMLKKIKKGKIEPRPLLVEGMACPFGCVGGPGTLAPLKRAQREAKKFAKQAKWQKPSDYIE